MQNKNDHYLKIKADTTAEDKEKFQIANKDQSNIDSKNKYGYFQRGSCR